MKTCYASRCVPPTLTLPHKGREFSRAPSGARRSLSLKRDAAHRRDQRVDILVRVVERERRPHRRLEPEAAQDRLRAVVAGAHRDAFPVERLADVLGAAAVEHEGDDARAFARRADEAQPRNAREPATVALDQLVLVARDRLDADAVEIVDRGAEADGVGDIAGAGLEPRGAGLVERASRR